MGRLVRSAALALALPALTHAAASEWRHNSWQQSREAGSMDYETRRSMGMGKQGGGGPGGWDASGLEMGLKSGGAEGLINALKAMQEMRQSSGGAANAHIKRDANGQLMYDFRSPSTTPAPAPAPTLAPPVALAQPPALPPVPSLPKLGELGKRRRAEPTPGLPTLPTLPQQQQQGALGGPPPPQQAAFGGLPLPQPAAFGAMPMQQQAGAPGQAVGGFQLQALAAGLEAVKERVDVLVEDAQMAMGGRAIPSVGLVQPAAAQTTNAGVSAELQKSVKDLLPRVAALEKESKVIQQQVKQVNLRKKDGNATKATAAATSSGPDAGRLAEQNQHLQQQLQKQAKEIEAVKDAEKSEKERLGKVEAENGELQKEVQALLALEKKRMQNIKKRQAMLRRQNQRTP